MKDVEEIGNDIAAIGLFIVLLGIATLFFMIHWIVGIIGIGLLIMLLGIGVKNAQKNDRINNGLEYNVVKRWLEEYESLGDDEKAERAKSSSRDTDALKW